MPKQPYERYSPPYTVLVSNNSDIYDLGGGGYSPDVSRRTRGLGVADLTLSAKLERAIATGDLQRDEAQMQAVAALDNLLGRLRMSQKSWLSFFKPSDPPMGLYLWGGVGRGKSMLMDWFFEIVPVEKKRRVHFHAFMLDVHARITAHRKTEKGDPIKAVAKDIAGEVDLLCFDEFHVTDITDAMILSRLFQDLFERDLVMLATSNRAPDELYKNGLNRGLFEPFIDLLKSKCEVVEFAGDVDHRLRQLEAAPVYYAPLGSEADAAMDAAWLRLTGAAQTRETILSVQGRDLVLSQTAAGTARTSFDRLCGRPLGSADYLRLSHAFQTLILDHVPQMGPDMRNEAKRFVTLIDALYETRTKLIMSAEVEPHDLYKDGDGSFEFERTVSRVIEMRSRDYLGARRIMGEE